MTRHLVAIPNLPNGFVPVTMFARRKQNETVQKNICCKTCVLCFLHYVCTATLIQWRSVRKPPSMLFQCRRSELICESRDLFFFGTGNIGCLFSNGCDLGSDPKPSNQVELVHLVMKIVLFRLLW